jgi:hypothetical protein
MNSDRRRTGRPRNPNREPCNAHIATHKEVVDELDRLVVFQRMPLGQKLEHLILEVKQYRKNLVGQSPISQPMQQTLTNESINQLNESIEEQFDRELAELLNEKNRSPRECDSKTTLEQQVSIQYD